MDVKTLVKALLHDIRENNIQDSKGKLPSEPDLMSHYEVTRYTLRSALSILVDQGFIYQVQGKGTYTRKRNHSNAITLDHTEGLTEEARRLGRELKTVYAKLSVVKAKDALFLPEDIAPDSEEELYFVERLRYLDDDPFVLEHSYYKKAIVPYLNGEIIEGSIYKYVREALKVNLGFADKFIYCEACPNTVSKELKLVENGPVLVLKDEVYLNSGEICNFSKLFYHPDIQFFMLAKMS